MDFWAQLLALIIPVTTATVMGEPGQIILCYFTVGGVQLLSCIINRLGLDKFMRKPGRTTCEFIWLVLWGILGLCFVAPIVTILYLYRLLLVAPVFAVWYMVISYNEMSFIRAMIAREQYNKI